MPRASSHTYWLLYGPGPHSNSAFMEEGMNLLDQAGHNLSLAAGLFKKARGADKAVEATMEAVEKADTAVKATLTPRYWAALDEIVDWTEKPIKDGYLKKSEICETEDTDMNVNTEQGFPPHDRSPPETPPPEKRRRRRFKSKP